MAIAISPQRKVSILTRICIPADVDGAGALVTPVLWEVSENGVLLCSGALVILVLWEESENGVLLCSEVIFVAVRTVLPAVVVTDMSAAESVRT